MSRKKRAQASLLQAHPAGCKCLDTWIRGRVSAICKRFAYSLGYYPYCPSCGHYDECHPKVAA